MKYSVVITSYNRAWCIERAISSALMFLMDSGSNGEVIIVDDGSTDETVAIVKIFISSLNEVSREKINLFVFPENRGVCAAKNFGAKLASGEWVISLDSDDEMIVGSYNRMNNFIDDFKGVQAHFFDTINESAINRKNFDETIFLGINDLVINGTNGRDAVPVIRKEVRLLYPYNESIRGYEGLSYLSIAKEYGVIPLHGHAIIQLHTTHVDRLSSLAGQKTRYCSLADGHKIALSMHWDAFSWVSRVKMMLRYLKAWYLS